MKRKALLVATAISITLGACSFTPRNELDERAQNLQKKFAKPDQTLEYHFMIKAPPFTDENRNQVLAGVIEALKPIGEVGALKGPRTGIYLDSADRSLDKARLILRIRPGLITVKARSTSLSDLMDLAPCKVIKYENDYFDVMGYSISSEYPFKKEEWVADTSKVSVGQALIFLEAKCPELAKQLEVHLKPLSSLTAPSAANMYSADFKFKQSFPASFKDVGFSAWTFPGTKSSLAEIAWTGYVKDKAALDKLYSDTRDKLQKAGLLADDQSSKTDQYFKAYRSTK
jgi:hypothetical protein